VGILAIISTRDWVMLAGVIMASAYPKGGRDLNRHSGGFALIIILVAMAILLLLYFTQIDVLFEPASPGKSTRTEHRPWLEEDRIVPGDKLIKPPRPPRPKLNEPITLTAPVFLDDSRRGIITVGFTAVGEVGGSWGCEYSHGNRDYALDAVFTGNIDITKTYSEGGTTDKSKLYFITKGNYTQTAYNVEVGAKTSEQGLVYVTGWLAPDHSAEGLITITTDKTWSATYAWQAE
jgi:hypothetical protein